MDGFGITVLLSGTDHLVASGVISMGAQEKVRVHLEFAELFYRQRCS